LIFKIRFATMLEAVAYADFAGLLSPLLGVMGHDKLPAKVAYIFLDLLGRSVFEYLAFSAVTELWLQTAFQASPAMSQHFQGSLVVRSISRVMGCISVLLSGLLALYLLADTHSLDQIERTDLFFRLQIFMEALCWTVAAGFVVMCVKITSERIQISFATFPPNDALERTALTCQALVPMVVCSLTYAIRSVFLLFRLTGQTPFFTATTRFHPVWWVVFVWAPTFLVVICALYSARRRDRSVLDTDAQHVPLLGTPTPPPAEAFQNFRRFADGVLSPFTSPVRESRTIDLSMHRTSSQDDVEEDAPMDCAPVGADNLGESSAL